ncbi:hypothetical protein [Butyrivibrio fibrisolvens]|uniref:hypothetical protein n=1 Tax=Butyrivibrio fibrisolvens TaxID=831 RepID=UPI0003B518CB|nr:hypothetical protein [Butyrivibrio fibrisolvens]
MEYSPKEMLEYIHDHEMEDDIEALIICNNIGFSYTLEDSPYICKSNDAYYYYELGDEDSKIKLASVKSEYDFDEKAMIDKINNAIRYPQNAVIQTITKGNKICDCYLYVDINNPVDIENDDVRDVRFLEFIKYADITTVFELKKLCYGINKDFNEDEETDTKAEVIDFSMYKSIAQKASDYNIETDCQMKTPDAKFICVNRFTLDAFKAIYEDADKIDWLINQHPYTLGLNFKDFISVNKANLNDPEFFEMPIKCSLIDGRFFKWLKDRKNEFNDKRTKEYAYSIGNVLPFEDNNSFLINDYHLVALPLIIIKDENYRFDSIEDFSIGMNQDVHKKLKTYLSNIFPKERLYIPRCYCDLDSAFLNQDKIFEVADRYFNGSDEEKTILEHEYFNCNDFIIKDDTDFLVACIPAVIKGSAYSGMKISEYIYDTNAFNNPECLDLDTYDDNLIYPAAKFTPFKDTGLDKLIVTNFGNEFAKKSSFIKKISVQPILLGISEVENYEDFSGNLVDGYYENVSKLIQMEFF